MTKENWLCMLKMRKSWRGGITVLFSFSNQCALKGQNLFCDSEHVINCVEAKVCCDLVIT